MLTHHAASRDAQPRGSHWERRPATSPALEEGIGLSLEAADVAFGRIAAPRAETLLKYKWVWVLWGKERKGGFSGVSWQ